MESAVVVWLLPPEDCFVLVVVDNVVDFVIIEVAVEVFEIIVDSGVDSLVVEAGVVASNINQKMNSIFVNSASKNLL